MSDLRPVLERVRDRIPGPPGGLERLINYRERRQRRRRIGTIGGALVLGLAGTLVAVGAFAVHERPKPAGLVPHSAIAFVRGTTLAGASIPDAEIYLMEPDGSGVRKLTDAGAEGKVAAEPAWSPDGSRIAFVLSTPEHLGAYAGDGDICVMNADGTGLIKLTDGLRDAHPAWSPDGDRIVFVRDQGNSLMVMNADGSDVSQIRPDGEAFPPYESPTWSPDGTHIAFQASPSAGVDANGVYVTDVDGNATARLTPGSSDGYPAWSPDGTTLAYAGSNGIYLHDMQAGTNRRLTACGKRENCGFDFEPSWAPDGSRLVFARQDYGGGSIQIFVVNADGTGLRQVSSGPNRSAQPIWQPVAADGSIPSPSGSPTAFATSPGLGRLIVVLGAPNAGIFSMATDGSDLRQITLSSHDEDAVASPDGRKIAFVRHGIYVMNADGTNLHQLTTDGSDNSPTWSPDGTTIAFSREVAGVVPNTDIFTVPAGGGPVVQMTDDPSSELTPAWSPDGARIAFGGYEQPRGQPPTPVRLYVMRSDGTGIELLGGADVAQPAWSPDGARISFGGGQDEHSVFVIHSDGSGLRELYAPTSPGGFAFSPAWSPDGTQIAFVSGDTITDLQVFIINADGSGPKQVTTGPSEATDVSWAPSA